MNSQLHGTPLSRLLTILLFWTVCCLSTPAFSQAEPTSREKMDLAVESASALFAAEEYEAAAKKFAEAFGHLKNYNLKKNEMVAWFKADNCSSAIDAARLYLSAAEGITTSDQVDVKTVRVRCLLSSGKKFLNLGSLEKSEAKLNEAESLIISDDYSPGADSKESEEIEVMRQQITSIKSQEIENVEPAESSSIAGPILTITGGVMAIGGGVLLFLSKDKESEYTCSKNVEISSCGDNPTVELTEQEFDDLKSSASLLNTLGWIGVASGAAVGGIGVYLWASDDSSEETARIVVSPGLNRVGFELSF